MKQNLIKDCYRKSIHLIPTRRKLAKRLLLKSTETYKDYHLSVQDKEDIRKVWGSIKVDLDWFRLFNVVKRENDQGFDARYIPMDIAYAFIYPYFNHQQASSFMDDKNFYDMYFHDVRRPRTICRVIDGIVMDPMYQLISIDEALSLCREAGNVIVKPSALTSGGSGVKFFKTDDYNEIAWTGNRVIQEVIKQHRELAKLHEDSVNTLRIATFHDGKAPSIIGAVVRTGANGSNVDNASMGGLFCGIKDDGTLRKFAYNRQGIAFTQHPQGAVFADCRIPNYEKCKALVLGLSNRLVKVARMISWDIAIDEVGEPVLIEVNIAYSGVDLFQIANGPLFGDRTAEVISEVFSDKLVRIANRFL